MKPAPARGFTLFEVLLALALVALLAGAIFALISQLATQRQRIGDDWRRWRSSDVLFDSLERDLACVIAGDKRIGAGIKGDESSLTLLTRAVWIEPDSPAGSAASRDLIRATYRFGDSGEARCDRAVVLRDGNAGSPPPPRDGAFGDELRSVRLRYFDGRGWKPSFDSLRVGHLPQAVEIAVWLAGAGPTDGTNGGTHSPPDRLRVIVVPDARELGTTSVARVDGRAAG